MKKIFFLIYSISIASACFAQQKELDSLISLVAKHPQEDSIRLKWLNDISFDYCEIDATKGLVVADEAIALAKKLNLKRNTASAYGNKGLNYIRLGEDSLAEEMYNKSLEIFTEIKDQKGVAAIEYRMGELYFNKGEYYKALDNLQKSEDFFKPADNNFLMNVYNSMGGIYNSLANYNKALTYYFKALNVAEKSGDVQTTATVFGNIGVFYLQINDFVKSRTYHTKALHLYEQLGNNIGIAMELEGIGISYDNLDDKTQALTYYKKALSINEGISNVRGIASNLSNIASIYYDRTDYEQTMKNLLKAKSIYEKLDDKYSLATVLNMIGDTYTNAPQALAESFGSAQNKYVTANEYNEKALSMARESDALAKQEEILQSMTTVYEKQKDYQKAAEVYKQLLPLHDSIANDKKKDEITRQELNYEFDKKETLAAAEIKRQQTVKNATIAGGAVLLLSAITSFVFYKRRRDAEGQKTEAEFKTQVSDVEMKALRSQMNPHFIFNSLHSINKYMTENDKENASEYLSRFSKLMRLILENSREQEVTLEKDLMALELYLKLESLRFQNRFSYKIEVDTEIETDNTLVPPMLIQPFVENAIIHGVANKTDGLIRIKVNKAGSCIKCTVEDNGIGRQQSIAIKPKEEKKQESLGMKITQERLNILNQIKKVKSAINIFDLTDANNNPSGLRIELSLPFEQAF